MKKIWKYSMAGPDCKFTMPKGAEILTVQIQYGIPQIWALVNPDADLEVRHLVFYGTGHGCPDNPGKYIGTFQINAGSLIFHVFEEI